MSNILPFQLPAQRAFVLELVSPEQTEWVEIDVADVDEMCRRGNWDVSRKGTTLYLSEC